MEALNPLITFKKIMALLNILQLHYRCAHWESKGTDSYARHLLFERLYDTVAADIDEVAEKVIGVWGLHNAEEIFVDVELTLMMARMMMELPHISDEEQTHLPKSYYLEKVMLKYLDRVYEELESSGEMTMGLDDFVMALYSKHEHNLYLIQQALK
jgi:DNA-binding ferritin-like protein